MKSKTITTNNSNFVSTDIRVYYQEDIDKAKKEERQRVIEEVEKLSNKELKEQMALASKTGDEQKARLAGYANGVIKRLLNKLKGINE